MHTKPVEPAAGTASHASLYDSIMERICPPLTSAQFDKTMADVHAMPPEEQEKRLAAYEWGFQVFEVVLQDMTGQWAAEARERQGELHARLHAQEEAQRASEVTDAESRLDSLPSDR